MFEFPYSFYFGLYFTFILEFSMIPSPRTKITRSNELSVSTHNFNPQI